MLILNEEEVRQCLPMARCIDANRRALGSIRESGNGGSLVPPRIGVPYYNSDTKPTRTTNNKKGDDEKDKGTKTAPADWTLIKPAAYYPKNDDETQGEKDECLMGLKVVSVRANNPSKFGKPTVPATVMMVNAETGEVNAVLAGTYLTAARTAAGSAIATQHCLSSQNESSESKNNNLVLFGAGLQAEAHMEALSCVIKIRKVTIVNRTMPRALALKERFLQVYDLSSPEDVQVVLLHDEDMVEAAVRDAHVIVTATNSATPLFDGDWARAGCHINGVGSYTPTMQEVGDSMVRRCQVLMDTPEAREVGDLKDCNQQIIVGLLGDVLAGTACLDPNGLSKNDATPQDRTDCTFFKSVGTAIQDILTATEVIKNARASGIGTTVDM
jgi:ornithine cyclodeaminase